jgi:hypothetical protein
VLPVNTSTPFTWYDFPLAILKLPVELTVPLPPRGERVILPVVPPPIVSVWLLVVVRLPEASKVRLPERVAVCCPRALFTPSTANFALVEDVPPIAKSTVEFFGERSPFA